jgi:hypothetical protein
VSSAHRKTARDQLKLYLLELRQNNFQPAVPKGRNIMANVRHTGH